MANRDALLIEAANEINKYARRLAKCGQEICYSLQEIARAGVAIVFLCGLMCALSIYKTVTHGANQRQCQEMATVGTVAVGFLGLIAVWIQLTCTQLYKHYKFGTLDDEPPHLWFLLSYIVTVPATPRTLDKNVGLIRLMHKHSRIYLIQARCLLAIVAIGCILSALPIMTFIVNDSQCGDWRHDSLLFQYTSVF